MATTPIPGAVTPQYVAHILRTSEARLTELKRLDLEHFTKVTSEGVFANQGLQRQIDELKHLYTGQLHMLNTFGTIQKQVNEELHHNIVQPLQLENQQLKQQLFVEQAKVQIGIKNEEEITADLGIRLQALFEQEFQSKVKELEDKAAEAFNREVDRRVQARDRGLAAEVANAINSHKATQQWIHWLRRNYTIQLNPAGPNEPEPFLPADLP